MSELRDVYARKALSQIPRLLGLMDRNPYSSTYGCLHRDYWLDKTSDFPDAVRQFSVHALALVYKHDFPGNIYKGQPKIRDWTIAGLNFWAKIQHGDGSFDEFYPFERGWVGPTAFTMYTSAEAFRLMADEISGDDAAAIRSAIKTAAYFIAAGESEKDDLANHHAMACLAVWKAYELLNEPALKDGFERLWQGFLSYHRPEEGWSVEYDGVDPGYLSATVSFLAKIYETNPSPDILEVIRQSVEFCGNFAYPNGFYGGSLGSRSTLHFYPHGFELMGEKIPMAAAIGVKMLVALSEDKLVPPEIISDRYVGYRVPEFLLAYLDSTSRPEPMPLLPHERENFSHFYRQSRIFAGNHGQMHAVSNLAKGGVVKVFNRDNGQLLLNDCGIIGELNDHRIITSHWIDPDYHCEEIDQGWKVEGELQEVPPQKTFTPFKNLLFRGALVSLGWSSHASHWLKGSIRKTLMLGPRPVPIRFQRNFTYDGDSVQVTDQVFITGKVQFARLSFGD